MVTQEIQLLLVNFTWNNHCFKAFFITWSICTSVHQSSHICLTISAHCMLSQANKQHRSYPNEPDSLHYRRSPCNPSIIWSICYKLSNHQDCYLSAFSRAYCLHFSKWVRWWHRDCTKFTVTMWQQSSISLC